MLHPRRIFEKKGVVMADIISFLTSLSLWGNIVNCVAVMVGSSIGMLFKRVMANGKENGVTSRISAALMSGVALCVFLIGTTGAIKTGNILIVILSIVIGAIIGELARLQQGVERLGDKLENKMKGRFGNVSQGFVSASLLFCVGAMTILGSLESGLTGNHEILYTKSLLDLISSFVFASTLGFGVFLSSAFVLVFQGSITLLAAWIAPVLSDAVINEMSAVGSLLIVALSLNMLGLTKIKIMNYIPAIFLPILLCNIINI